MNKIFKTILSIILVVGMAGCTNSVDESLETLVNGIVSCRFKGEVTQGYLDLSGLSAEQSKEAYEYNLDWEVVYMLSLYLYNSEMTTGDIEKNIEMFKPLYKEMFASLNYSTSPLTMVDSKNAYITYSFQPILLADALDPVAFAHFEKNPTNEETLFYHLMLLDDDLFSTLYLVMENFLLDIQYGDEISCDVYLTSENGTSWDIDEESYRSFVNQIIDYNLYNVVDNSQQDAEDNTDVDADLNSDSKTDSSVDSDDNTDDTDTVPEPEEPAAIFPQPHPSKNSNAQ